MPSDFKHRFWLFFAFLVIQGMWVLLPTFCQSQEEMMQVRERFDLTYGADYNLLNGRQYFLQYSNTSDPFLNGELARLGRVVLNGVEYEGVPINYDLYQQVVLLQFISHTGEIRYLVFNREAVDEFTLDGKLFRKVPLTEEDEQYMQVIEAGSRRFFISWKKSMNFTASMNQTPYNYTKPSRRIYLENQEGKLHPVGSRSSFLAAFEESQRVVIKQYLRKERIRFKNATDRQLKQLLDYCIDLEEGGS